MIRIRSCIVALGVVALVTPTLHAQRRERPRFFGSGSSQVGLLSQESVREELKLTEEQTKKVRELAEQGRESFAELRKLGREEARKKFEERARANEKAIAEILKPEQVKRLKQISLQQRGTSALRDPEVAEALKLTDEQKEKLQAIQEETQKEMRGLFQGGNREEARKKFEELRKSSDEKRLAVLTDDQKAKWKELTGEPFKGEIRRPGFGQPRQRRGNQR